MEKIKIYDFDKTLVKGDSIFYLIKYGKNKKIFTNAFLIKLFLKSALKYLASFRFENFKSFAAVVVSKFTDDDLREFVFWHLKTNGFQNLIDEIHEEDYKTILCSASLERYVKIAAEYMDFDYVIATTHTTTKIIGENNAKREKLRRLNELFKTEGIVVDYENSKAYTDSYKNDKYMAETCKQKFLVNSDKKVEGYQNIIGKLNSSR